MCFSYAESSRRSSNSKPPTPTSSHRSKQRAWQTPPRTGERRSDLVSPPPTGPTSPREVSLTRGHNALTDLRRISTDSRSTSNDHRHTPTDFRLRGSQNRSAPTSRSDLSSGGLAARFSKSAEKHAVIPPVASSNLPPKDVLTNRSRIPLTGDRETDENIMAFLKARDHIMQEQTGKY